MELLFVILGGVLIGAVLRYLLPDRHSYGAALLPAVGGAAAAIVWAVLTWVGWRYDGGWIWVVSLVLAGAVSVLTAVTLPKRRRIADHELFASTRRA